MIHKLRALECQYIHILYCVTGFAVYTWVSQPKEARDDPDETHPT